MAKPDQTTFLTGLNAEYIAELHARFVEDPASVDESWRQFFASLEDEPQTVEKELKGPGWGRPAPPLIANGHAVAVPATNGHAAALPQEVHQAALDSVRAMNLIRAYRVRGHMIADLDPLGLANRSYHPDLDPATYGFTEADYDRPIFVNRLLGFSTATLKEILAALKATYCEKVGVEYMHIQELEQRQWIQARIEVPRNHTEFTV
ncbi:MAG TPA: 2-oxoglutarate dehydrogenase E1 component, partial [Stellaceae bacterium]|nr:2-oxoglutarate dehydrogenase E1 component [Stellaceae bacterium]